MTTPLPKSETAASSAAVEFSSFPLRRVTTVIATTVFVAAFIAPARASEADGLKRHPPLLHIPAERVLDVADFGAHPDDGRDDLPAIQLAMQRAAASATPTELRFAHGVYDIRPGAGKEQALIVERANDLIIDGRGARFVVHDSDRGFLQLRDCRGVILRNLSLEYVPLPFTQGIVKAVSARTHSFTVEIAPGFPSLDEPRFRHAAKQWGIVRDRRAPRLPKRGVANVFVLQGWRRVSRRGFEIRLPDWAPIRQIEPGDAYVQLARSGSAAFFSLRCRHVTLKNIRIYSAPAAAFLSMHCSSSAFVDCIVAPRKCCWQSIGADGVYSLCSRVGPRIEGCRFEALGDDAIVIKTFGANCIRKIDDRTLVLRPRPKYDGRMPPFPVRPGDLLRVFDLSAGRLVGEAHVAAAERAPGSQDLRGPVRIVLDKPVRGVMPGADWDSQVFYNESTAGAGFVVRNNVIVSPRRWGMLCESHDGIIEGNTFVATPAHALLFINADEGCIDSDGFASYNVIVRGNTFSDCFRQDPAPYSDFAGVVATAIILPTSRKTPFRSRLARGQWQRRITFENNRFVNWRRVPALFLSCARDIVVRGNEFSTKYPDAAPPIRAVRSSRLSIAGNRIRGPRRPFDLRPASTEAAPDGSRNGAAGP